jgi:hypothetical protein
LTEPVKTWDEKHAADFALIHEALHAIANLDLTGTAHADWLGTVRSVRGKVQDFALLIPNSDKIVQLLDVAEKSLLAVGAIANLAKDA